MKIVLTKMNRCHIVLLLMGLVSFYSTAHAVDREFLISVNRITVQDSTNPKDFSMGKDFIPLVLNVSANGARDASVVMNKTTHSVMEGYRYYFFRHLKTDVVAFTAEKVDGLAPKEVGVLMGTINPHDELILRPEVKICAANDYFFRGPNEIEYFYIKGVDRIFNIENNIDTTDRDYEYLGPCDRL